MAMNGRDNVKVHVAAFGKHPGWDDHIEEIGLDSALLVNAKRVLYTECIGGNIDSGVWEKLEEGKQLPFKHTFFWRSAGDVLVGRMWNSRDGKGRTKYPMIVCAHVEGVPAGWAISQILPRLADIEQKCSQTSSAELVRLAIGEARRSLEDAGAALVGGAPPEETTEALVARLVNHPAAQAEGREGLVRILYEMDRELAEFNSKTAATRTRSRMGDLGAPAAQHLRVPRLLDGPGEAARAWLALLDQEIDAGAPVLVIQPEGQGFLDIIVGDPKAGQFRCVRCGAEAIGLTSDVPYTLDDLTRQGALAKLASWAKGQAVAPKAAARTNGEKSSGKGIKIALAAAAVLLLIAIVIFAMRSGGNNSKVGDGSQTPKPSGATDQTASAPPKPETSAPKPGSDKPLASDSTPKGNDAADPRTAWGFDQAVHRVRAKLGHLNEELRAEGAPANTTISPKLDEAEQRAKILSATPWRSGNAESIARDMASIDAQVADADKEIDAALDGVSSRVADSLKQRGATANFQTDAMKRAWAGAVSGIDPTLGWSASKSRADALEAAMKSAETSIAAVPLAEAPSSSAIDAGTLKAAVTTRRDQALQTAANAAGDQAKVKQAVDQFRTWSAQASELVGNATRVESLLASGGDTGKEIADLVGKAQSSPVYKELSPALLPVFKQADALKTVEGQSSPDALITSIREASTDTTGRRAGEAAAAWARLPQVSWPDKPEDLAKATEIRNGALKAALGQLDDNAARSRLEAQADQTTKAMWLGFAERRGTDEAGLNAAAGARSAYGVTDADAAKLPGWTRYNLLRYDLGRSLATGKPEDRRAAFQRFVSGVDSLDAGTTARPEVAGVVSKLKPLLERGADLDLTKLGPGAAGWKPGPPSADGATVTYTRDHAGTTHTVQFTRLAEGDTVTFMATSEVSVGQFIDAVSDAGLWDDFKQLLSSYTPGGYDNRAGPRVWEWSAKGNQVMSVASSGPGDTSRGWLRAKSTMAGKEYYPSGLSVDPPTADSPMQYVSPQAAVLAARVMGCRLPTSAEWKRAQSAGATGTPNLRDQTWAREYERAKELQANGPEYPAAGIFWPAEAQKVQPIQDGAPAVDTDDGTLWFAPVTSGAGQGFQHLIGNVAEFVWEDPASIETVEATAARVRAALGKGEKLRVIGGSALSPKTISPSEPQQVRFLQASEGYSDVGFRLAFSAPKGAGGTGAKLDEALTSASYLKGPK
jgi:Sulfatase-modifying factor enzyme 1